MVVPEDFVEQLEKTRYSFAEVVKKFYDLTLAPPKDVTVEVYDENLNLIRETFPNYRKWLNTLLGQKRTLPYLDGGAITTEEELFNFILNVPAGGVGRATIEAPITLTKSVPIDGKYVTLIVDSDKGGELNFRAFLYEGVKRLPCFYMNNGAFLHFSVKGNVQNPVLKADLSGVDPTLPWDSWFGRRVMFLVVHSEVRFECAGVTSPADTPIVDLTADPSIGLAAVPRSRFFVNGSWKDANGNAHNGYIKLASTTQPVLDAGGYAEVSMGIRLMDAAGNDLFLDANGNKITVNWGDFIRNVVYDTALPTPRNVITPNKLL